MQVIKERQRGDELAADAGPGTPPPVEVRLSRAAGSERQPFSTRDGCDSKPAEAADAMQTDAVLPGAGVAKQSAARDPDGTVNAAQQPAAPASPHAAAAAATAASAEAGSPAAAGVAGSGTNAPSLDAAQPDAAVQTSSEAPSGLSSEANSEAGCDVGSDADSIAGGAATGSSVSLLAGTNPDVAAAAPALLRFGTDGDPQAQLVAEESWAATLEVQFCVQGHVICSEFDAEG